ncbi:MAG TPA: hypothetical protein VH351_21045 [Bryobacteraceae bacterium]|nr:hypothetical protein [Bryobacteraceae bacterium]
MYFSLGSWGSGAQLLRMKALMATAVEMGVNLNLFIWMKREYSIFYRIRDMMTGLRYG